MSETPLREGQPPANESTQKELFPLAFEYAMYQDQLLEKTIVFKDLPDHLKDDFNFIIEIITGGDRPHRRYPAVVFHEEFPFAIQAYFDAATSWIPFDQDTIIADLDNEAFFAKILNFKSEEWCSKVYDFFENTKPFLYASETLVIKPIMDHLRAGSIEKRRTMIHDMLSNHKTLFYLIGLCFPLSTFLRYTSAEQAPKLEYVYELYKLFLPRIPRGMQDYYQVLSDEFHSYQEKILFILPRTTSKRLLKEIKANDPKWASSKDSDYRRRLHAYLTDLPESATFRDLTL